MPGFRHGVVGRESTEAAAVMFASRKNNRECAHGYVRRVPNPGTAR